MFQGTSEPLDCFETAEEEVFISTKTFSPLGRAIISGASVRRNSDSSRAEGFNRNLVTLPRTPVRILSDCFAFAGGEIGVGTHGILPWSGGWIGAHIHEIGACQRRAFDRVQQI